jgi:hypothetical protein
MAKITLADFIREHRDDLIGRCRARVATPVVSAAL